MSQIFFWISFFFPVAYSKLLIDNYFWGNTKEIFLERQQGIYMVLKKKDNFCCPFSCDKPHKAQNDILYFIEF